MKLAARKAMCNAVAHWDTRPRWEADLPVTPDTLVRVRRRDRAQRAAHELEGRSRRDAVEQVPAPAFGDDFADIRATAKVEEGLADGEGAMTGDGIGRQGFAVGADVLGKPGRHDAAVYTGSIGDRIAWHRRAILELRQEQRDVVLPLLRLAYPPGTVFSALEVWLEDALRIVCLEAGLDSPQALGTHLRQWRGHGVARVGADRYGALWTCTD